MAGEARKNLAIKTWQIENSRITIAASQRKQRQQSSNRRIVRSEITLQAIACNGLVGA
jgi:hypothetical protein